MGNSQFEAAVAAMFPGRYKKGRSKGGTEFKVCCPFCQRIIGKPDRSFKLWMNPDKGVYRCWRCDTRGPLTDIFAGMRLEMQSTPVYKAEVVGPVKDLPGTTVRLDQAASDDPARHYMSTRGFNPSGLGRVYGVQSCIAGKVFGKSFKFDTTGTVIFPVWMNSICVGWQSRLTYNPGDLTDTEKAGMGWPVDDDGDLVVPPKYYTPYGMPKGSILYNYDNAMASELVVVCEGPTDVLATGPCAVGMFGKGAALDQIAMLKSKWRAIVLLLDPDAEEESYKLAEELSITVPVVVNVVLRGYDDPGSAPTRDIWLQIDAAMKAQSIDLSRFNTGPLWADDILRH